MIDMSEKSLCAVKKAKFASITIQWTWHGREIVNQAFRRLSRLRRLESPLDTSQVYVTGSSITHFKPKLIARVEWKPFLLRGFVSNRKFSTQQKMQIKRLALLFVAVDYSSRLTSSTATRLSSIVSCTTTNNFSWIKNQLKMSHSIFNEAFFLSCSKCEMCTQTKPHQTRLLLLLSLFFCLRIFPKMSPTESFLQLFFFLLSWVFFLGPLNQQVSFTTVFSFFLFAR